MRLTLKQTQALDILEDQETTELLFGGGAGGGKSAFGCYWQIKRRLKYPGTRGLIGRSKLKVLKDTTLKSFKDIAKMQGLIQNQHYKITSSHDTENPNCIVFFNGSLIYLRDLFLYPSDAEFDDLGSLEITDAFIDECNQMVEKAKGIVKSRIRYKLDEFTTNGERTYDLEVIERNNDGKPIKWLQSDGKETTGLLPKILGTCNPAKNWTYKQFYKPSKAGELPVYRKFIQSLLLDNPHISKHYRESLLTLNKNSRERLLNGNWEYDDDPAALMDADAIYDYFKPEHINTGGKKYMTIDVARKGKDKTVFRIWDGFLCIRRIGIAISLINEIVDKANNLRVQYAIPLSQIVADEDGVGGGVVDYLKCKGFVNNSSPLEETLESGEKIKPNYENLKTQCSFLMAKKIQSREAGERCEDMEVKDVVSEELEQIKQKDIDKDGKIKLVPKDKMKELLGRSPDDWDSIMMRYYFELDVHTEFFSF